MLTLHARMDARNILHARIDYSCAGGRIGSAPIEEDLGRAVEWFGRQVERMRAMIGTMMVAPCTVAFRCVRIEWCTWRRGARARTWWARFRRHCGQMDAVCDRWIRIGARLEARSGWALSDKLADWQILISRARDSSS